MPRGVVTKKGRHDLDALVLAVGFDAMTGALLAIDIEGRNGRSLRDKWADGPIHLSRHRDRGLSQLIHYHRAGQPVSTDQHDHLN